MPRKQHARYLGRRGEDQSCDIVQWPAESLHFRGGLLAGLTRRSFVLL